MQRLEVSGAVRPIYGSLGVKRLTNTTGRRHENLQNDIVGHYLYLCPYAVCISLFLFLGLLYELKKKECTP